MVDAVADEVGAERTAIRPAPFLTARGMDCPDILSTLLEAMCFLNDRGIGYVHLVEADWDDAPTFTDDFRREIRARFAGPIVVAGKYDRARCRPDDRRASRARSQGPGVFAARCPTCNARSY